MKPHDEAVGPALRAIRLAAGLTLAETAERAGLGTSYLSRVENGLVSPTAPWALCLALFLGNTLRDRQEQR